MVVIEAQTPLLGVIAAASAHGLTDFQRPPRELLPYAIVFAPMPTEIVTPIFLGCSMLHFARDIGVQRSVLLHATFIGLAPFVPALAWGIFALYYCAYHVPLHVAEHAALAVTKPRFAAAVAACAVVFALAVQGAEVFPLTDLMQLGIVAHVLVDEFTAAEAGERPGVLAGVLSPLFKRSEAPTASTASSIGGPDYLDLHRITGAADAIWVEALGGQQQRQRHQVQHRGAEATAESS